MSNLTKPYQFCPMCSSQMTTRIVNEKERPTCPICGWVHYRNPAIATATLITNPAGELLLIKRGPHTFRPHLWSVPAGFVDFGEEIRSAAQREVSEETGLLVDIGAVLTVTTNLADPEKSTICVWFRGAIVGGNLTAGDDATQVAFYPLDELPVLAFPEDMEIISEWLSPTTVA